MGRKTQKWPVTNTGSVVGGFATQPAAVTFHGFILYNTAAAGATVSFYEPTPVANGNYPLLPSAAGTLLFTIELAATSSTSLSLTDGMDCKYGLFVVSSATTCAGVVLYS